MDKFPDDVNEEAYDFSDLFSDWYGCDSAKRQALTNAFARAIMDERNKGISQIDHFINDITISVQGRSRFTIADINREANKAARYIRDRISGDYEQNWTDVPKSAAQ